LKFLDSDSSYLKQESEFILRPGTFQLPADFLDMEELEKDIIRKALGKFKGNKSKTAEYLCLTRSALRSRLSKL
jgi:DNA-binding NtrC family response regulator